MDFCNAKHQVIARFLWRVAVVITPTMSYFARMNYFPLFSGLILPFQGNGSTEAGETESHGLLEEETTNSSRPDEVAEPVTDNGINDDLPIGEAVPDGEHVRSLRIFSAGGEKKGPPRLNQTSDRIYDSSSSFRDVQVLRIFRNPDVMLSPNLLTKGQCLHLLHLAEGKWTRSKTSIGLSTAPQNEYTSTESRTRTSKSVMLEEAQTPGVASVERLACALARLPLQHLEPLVLVSYDEGEYFNEHHDGAFRPQTVLIYLNDVEEGGFTHFTRLGLKIAPVEGCAAVWRNATAQGTMDMRMLHAGVPPIKGTKYVVNCFFNESAIRAAQPERPLAAPEEAEAQSCTPAQGLMHESAMHQRNIEHFRVPTQQPMTMPALQPWPGHGHAQSWCSPASRAFAPQAAWGQAMLQVFHQLGHQEARHPVPRASITEMPKFMSSPIGFPSCLASPPDLRRGHAVVGMPQARHWLHSVPPKSS